MEMDYSGVRIDGFCCNQKTREKAFLRHFAMDGQTISSPEHIYPCRITEREGGLSLCGKVTAVTEGVIRYRNKFHTIRRPCLDISTPDGLLHKYAQRADKMQQVKAILGG